MRRSDRNKTIPHQDLSTYMNVVDLFFQRSDLNQVNATNLWHRAQLDKKYHALKRQESSRFHTKRLYFGIGVLFSLLKGDFPVSSEIWLKFGVGEMVAGCGGKKRTDLCVFISFTGGIW